MHLTYTTPKDANHRPSNMLESLVGPHRVARKTFCCLATLFLLATPTAFHPSLAWGQPRAAYTPNSRNSLEGDRRQNAALAEAARRKRLAAERARNEKRLAQRQILQRQLKRRTTASPRVASSAKPKPIDIQTDSTQWSIHEPRKLPTQDGAEIARIRSQASSVKPKPSVQEVRKTLSTLANNVEVPSANQQSRTGDVGTKPHSGSESRQPAILYPHTTATVVTAPTTSEVAKRDVIRAKPESTVGRFLPTQTRPAATASQQSKRQLGIQSTSNAVSRSHSQLITHDVENKGRVAGCARRRRG